MAKQQISLDREIEKIIKHETESITIFCNIKDKQFKRFIETCISCAANSAACAAIKAVR